MPDHAMHLAQRTTDSVIWKLLDGSLDEWLKFIGGFVALVGMLWLIVRVKAWLQGDRDPAAEDESLLTQFRELHRQGELSEEEYRSIKSRLVARLDGSLRANSPRSKTESQERERDGKR